jgi:hypothetical protein
MLLIWFFQSSSTKERFVKKFYLSMMLSLVSLTAAAADISVETQASHYQARKSESQVIAVVSGNVSGPIGYFVLGQAISSGYKQFYGGPSLKLGPIEVGAGIGREDHPGTLRHSEYIVGGLGKVSFAYAFEGGGSGPWHTGRIMYQVTPNFRLGAMDQSYFGAGPRIEYTLTRNVQVWAAIVREHHTHQTNGKAAVVFRF